MNFGFDGRTPLIQGSIKFDLAKGTRHGYSFVC